MDVTAACQRPLDDQPSSERPSRAIAQFRMCGWGIRKTAMFIQGGVRRMVSNMRLFFSHQPV